MSVESAVDAGAIRQRAYELWEQDGRPEGREFDYWLKAEAEFASREPAAANRPGDDMSAPAVPDEPLAKPRSRERTRA